MWVAPPQGAFQSCHATNISVTQGKISGDKILRFEVQIINTCTDHCAPFQTLWWTAGNSLQPTGCERRHMPRQRWALHASRPAKASLSLTTRIPSSHEAATVTCFAWALISWSSKMHTSLKVIYLQSYSVNLFPVRIWGCRYDQREASSITPTPILEATVVSLSAVSTVKELHAWASEPCTSDVSHWEYLVGTLDFMIVEGLWRTFQGWVWVHTTQVVHADSLVIDERRTHRPWWLRQRIVFNSCMIRSGSSFLCIYR